MEYRIARKKKKKATPCGVGAGLRRKVRLSLFAVNEPLAETQPEMAGETGLSMVVILWQCNPSD